VTIVAQFDTRCPVCQFSYNTDIPGFPSVTGGGFYADLQPALSEPIHGIWETALVSCPQCAYTTYGPSSIQDSPPSPALAAYVRETLTPFVKRQKPSISAQPGLTSKYELYALELDFQRADDHLIGDQFLRASWSARIRSRAEEMRRLRSLAASYYEKALSKTAGHVLEERVIVLYLLAELYRLLGEQGEHRKAFERLVPLRGGSTQGDVLIEAAECQFKSPHEGAILRAAPGTMDFLGSYRGRCLLGYAYVALRNGELTLAKELFLRVLGFCEGPLRTRLYLLRPDAGLVMCFKLDDFGGQAAIGLRETCRRLGRSAADVLARIDPLVRRMEKAWGVSADEVCRFNVSEYELPRKPGWRSITQRKKDPKSYARTVWPKRESDSSNVQELIDKAADNYNVGAFDSAQTIAEEAIAICAREMECFDPGVEEQMQLARLKIKAHRIAAMSGLRAGAEVEPLIGSIERALEGYHVIGGPKTGGTFAFLLGLLAIAFERKQEVTAAQEALQKANQLIEAEPLATFHYGRQLFEFPPTATLAEPVLRKAMEEGKKASLWVEGAAALALAELNALKGRSADALELFKRVVAVNYIHAPTLPSYDIANQTPAIIPWVKHYCESEIGRNQLRPWWRNKTTEGAANCAGCGRRLPYTKSDRFLTVAPELIQEFLENEQPIGLACNKCGIFGACCWNWHNYDAWDSTDEPFYTAICPRCSALLYGA